MIDYRTQWYLSIDLKRSERMSILNQWAFFSVDTSDIKDMCWCFVYFFLHHSVEQVFIILYK